jgi:uncharacterized protein
MRWQEGRRSANVEDRRGMGTRVAAGGGIATVLLGLLVWFLGGDPTSVVDVGRGSGSDASPVRVSGEERQLADFVAVVLADTEDVWREQFRKMGRTYEEPRLVLFRGRVESACGFASAAVGPFYCPEDRRVYIDLSFYDELQRRFHAPGDFAQAYVIAHEIGHHVQTLLGISDRVHRQQQRATKTQANALSVRMELQADYLAGVWAHHAEKVRHVLEPGDVDEALRAATAIGDDRLQMQARGYVVPDSFTHGTSTQRRGWFRRGFESGDPLGGDTFDDRVFAQVPR